MLMIAPERAGLWREAGVLHAHLDNMRAAILAFEHYLELAAPGDPGRQDISELLRQLRRLLNSALARTPGTGTDHPDTGRSHTNGHHRGHPQPGGNPPPHATGAPVPRPAADSPPAH